MELCRDRSRARALGRQRERIAARRAARGSLRALAALSSVAIAAATPALADAAPSHHASTHHAKKHHANTHGAGNSESVAVPGSAGSYVSAPALHPAQLNVDVSRSGKASGLIFIDPFASSPKPLVGEEGVEILSNDGQPVWTHAAGKGEAAVDFEAQTYEGKPVLTWWQGHVAVPPRFTNLPEGSPEPGARYYVYNDHYKRIKTVVAQEGWTADLHEFKITPRNTALFIAYKTVPVDLTPYGGSAEGSVEDAEIQEVSLKTGKLLFKWDMLEHVPLSESEVAAPPSGIWDAYHMNSVAELPGGKLLISARNTWAVYEVSRKGGKTVWQLGGKHSSFSMSPNAEFYWQHDARLEGNSTVTVFDDGCCNLGATGLAPAEQRSHGLVLKLDLAKHTATAERRYFHSPQLYTPSQGDLQRQGNGNALVGWGQFPYLSEYSRSGKLVYAASLPEADESYRALRFSWDGMPLDKPSLAAIRAGGRTKLYMSWNGATQVERWTVLAGASEAALRSGHGQLVARVKRSGFETSAAVAAKGPYFEADAIGAGGRVLRVSKVEHVGAKAKKASRVRGHRARHGHGAHRAKSSTGAFAPRQTDVVRSGALKVKLDCPRAAAKRCVSKLTLRAKGVSVGSGKTLILGHATVTVAAGRSAGARVKLSGEAEKAVKQAHGKLVVEAIVVSVDGRKVRASRTMRITLRQAPKKEEPTSLY